MTRAELVAKIANETGITRALAEKAVEGLLAAVSGALGNGERVSLVGFGTFSVAPKARRRVPDPRTGEKIAPPASKAVQFKAGRNLSGMVKQ